MVFPELQCKTTYPDIVVDSNTCLGRLAYQQILRTRVLPGILQYLCRQLLGELQSMIVPYANFRDPFTENIR